MYVYTCVYIHKYTRKKFEYRTKRKLKIEGDNWVYVR